LFGNNYNIDFAVLKIKNNLHKIRVTGQLEIKVFNNAVKLTIIYGFQIFINLFW
jgi:hypothetical protein